MALVVEDGTGVVGADSYVSVADARTYATKRGVALSAEDATVEVQLRKSFDFIETVFGERFRGYPVTPGQPTSWPRIQFRRDYAYDYELSTVIPAELIAAQIEGAMAIHAGIDLMPNVAADATAQVIREKVGPIETEYASRSSGMVSTMPTLPRLRGILRPILRKHSFRTRRV